MISTRQYDSIPIINTIDKGRTAQDAYIGQESRCNCWFPSSNLAGVCMIVVLIGMLSSSYYFSPRGDTRAALIQGASFASTSNANACTFEECYASNCNQDVNPYTCLWHNGGFHGGCSAIPWTQESCEVSCSLAHCKDLPIPDTIKGCTDACPNEWCRGGQVCHVTAPYQCMTGSARFGCSAEPLMWTLKTDGSTCSSCCDTGTC